MLCPVLIDVMIIAEHTKALIPPKSRIRTVTWLHSLIEVAGSPLLIEHLVVAVTSVQSHMILEVLTNLVTPRERELPSPVVHRTIVVRCTLVTNDRRNSTRVVQQDVAVALMIVVECQVQTTVKEACIDTQVKLIRLTPVNIWVVGCRVLVHTNTVGGCLALVVLTKDGTLIQVEVIVRLPLPWSNVITTGYTVRYTKLQVIEPLQPFSILKPRLLADSPTQTECWEGSPIV